MLIPHHHYTQGIWRSLPLQLAQTTAGARLDCKDDHCRLANTITALADCSLTILLLLLLSPKLRRHVEAVTHRVDQHRVTVADYSIELRRLPETVTQDQVRQTVGRTLKRHAEARLQRLEQKEAAAITRTTSLSRMQRPVQLRSLQREVSLLHGAIEQVQRFIAEEKWRVHEDGVTLCLRNGRLLSRAQQKVTLLTLTLLALTVTFALALALTLKPSPSPSPNPNPNPNPKVPLLHRIELHQKGDERIKALRRGPPSCWERFGDWRRARQLRREQGQLKATSAELLQEMYNGSDAQRVVSAIVTFEEEEGKLESLHAFPPVGFGSCSTGAPVAKEAPEPSDRFLHNLEHRGSCGNLARALFSFAAQLVVVGASFGVLFASQNVDELLNANSTSSATSFACDGITMLYDRGNEQITKRVGNGGDDTGALAGEEAGSGGALNSGTEDVDELCLGLSTQATPCKHHAHTLLHTYAYYLRGSTPLCQPLTDAGLGLPARLRLARRQQHPLRRRRCARQAATLYARVQRRHVRASSRGYCCSPAPMYRRCSPGCSGLAPSVASRTSKRAMYASRTLCMHTCDVSLSRT